MMRKIIIAAFIALVVIVGFSAVYPLDPALGKTSKYERRYHVSFRFPFFSSYLLFIPPRYDPKTKYPIVVVLHGGHKRSLAAFVAAQDKFQEQNPAFVLMPMAQFRQLWAVPPGADRALGVTEALPTAIDIAEEVIEEFPIDRDRVYVTGSSNGAIGTFAAMAKYQVCSPPELPSMGSGLPVRLVHFSAPTWQSIRARKIRFSPCKRHGS